MRKLRGVNATYVAGEIHKHLSRWEEILTQREEILSYIEFGLDLRDGASTATIMFSISNKCCEDQTQCPIGSSSHLRVSGHVKGN